jgi:hypothetical protein
LPITPMHATDGRAMLVKGFVGLSVAKTCGVHTSKLG